MNSFSQSLKRRYLAAAYLLLLLWVALLVYLFADFEEDAEAGSGERIERPPTLEVLYSFDTTDPRKLVGYSDAVFVGRALEKTGEESLESSIPGEAQPQTQFAVEVGEVISGDGLEKGREITVNQIGGSHPKTGRSYVVSGVVGENSYLDSLLSSGEEYLLAVKRNEATGYYDVSAQPHGDVPLSGASSRERQRIVSAFERAARDPAENPLGGGESPPRP